MRQYHDLLDRILREGVRKDDRTGTGTLSVFGHQMRFDLAEGFPLVTTKRVFWRGVVEELLWMLSGSTNVKPLQEKGITIWDEWGLKEEDLRPHDFRKVGDLGPVYGKQWRSWTLSDHPATADTLDQISLVIDQLRTNPDSRRIIVTAWNPAEIDQMRLPPCHMMFQFYSRPMSAAQRWSYALDIMGRDFAWGDEVEMHMDCNGVPSRYLDLQLYQRSADVFLGVPFNIASYALLTTLIAREVGMAPGEFVWTGGDTHLYLNHLDQAREQMTREPRPLPTLAVRTGAPGIFDLQFGDLELVGYDPYPAISAPVAV